MGDRATGGREGGGLGCGIFVSNVAHENGAYSDSDSDYDCIVIVARWLTINKLHNKQ